MSIILGLIVTLACMLGGYAALGGHIAVLWQPFEYIIIGGSSFGTFLISTPMKVIKDTGKALKEAFKGKTPSLRDYLDVLGLLFALMREIRAKSRNEAEAHIDSPEESPIFQKFDNILKDEPLKTFICDYFRLVLIGNAKSHEIESLMDEELETMEYDNLKPYHAVTEISDGLPALGIVAAVLGVIHALGALDESPEVLGHLIGGALVGTFSGIFMSYAVAAPIATKIKVVRTKNMRPFIIVKLTILAYINGAMPQVALEYGRKTISLYERPTIDELEEETLSSGSEEPVKLAA